MNNKSRKDKKEIKNKIEQILFKYTMPESLDKLLLFERRVLINAITKLEIQDDPKRGDIDYARVDAYNDALLKVKRMIIVKLK